MAKAVGDIGDKVKVGALRSAEQTVDGLDDGLDDVDVLPLVETADVIGLGYLSVMENHIDSTCMVDDIQPVAHVLALAVDRKRLAVADVLMKRGMSFSGNW